MSKNNEKLYFDSLDHATILQEGGVERADVHTRALKDALSQNVYTKIEVDTMLETALKRFDERSYQLRDEFNASHNRFDEKTQKTFQKFDERTAKIDERNHQMQLEMKSIETRFEKVLNRNLYATVAAIGSIIAIAGFVSTYFHSFAHVVGAG